MDSPAELTSRASVRREARIAAAPLLASPAACVQTLPAPAVRRPPQLPSFLLPGHAGCVTGNAPARCSNHGSKSDIHRLADPSDPGAGAGSSPAIHGKDRLPCP